MELHAERAAFPARGEGLAELCAAYGFDYYLLASFPRADKSGLLDGPVLSNWPEKLLCAYSEADALRCSKIVAALKESVMPVFTDGRVFFHDAEDREISGLPVFFDRSGFENVLYFSLHDAVMEPYIVAFSGRRPQPALPEIMEIYFSTMQELDRSAVIAIRERPRERLTAREIECLRWSAAGKSSDEIAIILAISSHTVISYLKSAMRKLDAVSRMQAIARAYRFRML